ncbi:MAG: type II toxin-antitoxin system VapC family toxin [Candidatus Daviesbacteria bacterium]|nr:type II toxin-antitoxin system VapC family toxin [Candidatus Daviesbacteria bacterium]
MKVVVDSSIIIDYLRGGKKWDEFIDYAPRDIQLFLPTVVIFELFSGSSTRNARKLQEMIAFIREFQRIDLNETIARVAGELFRDTKIKIQAADCIIAATALEIGGKILTLNRKHFDQIPGLAIYVNS